MLEIKQLIAHRDARVFNYNLSLEPGQALLLTGASGCGKSTLLDLVGGYLNADQGQILWQGKDISDLDPQYRPVTTLFQDKNLFDHLTVLQNLTAALPHCSSDQILTALRDLGVDDQQSKFPTELSGGQLKRVAIIAAVLRPEPILLMDEPFRELDPETRSQCMDWAIAEIHRSGKSLILVSHSQEDADQLQSHYAELIHYKLTDPD